jgi:ABC-type glycerol-3-phosphate transport system substrate-binding protein
MNKKRYALIYIINFLVILLTACQNNNNNQFCNETNTKANQPVTINFWVPGSFEPNKEYFIQAVEEFNTSQNNIKVIITFLPGPPEQIDLKLNAAQMGDFYPDVFSSYLYFIGTRGIQEFADITAYFNNWEDKDDIYDNTVKLGMIENKLFGIGYYPSPEIMVYRKDFFVEAGINPNDPPTSWEAVAPSAKLMTKRDKDTVVRAGLDIPIINANIYTKLFMRQNGAKVIDEANQKILFNKPEAIKALEYVIDLKNKNVSIPYDWAKKEESPFYKGKSAMAILNISAITKLINSNVEFAQHIGFIPLLSTKKKSAFCGHRFLVIGQKSKYKDESWEFIKFLMSKEQMIKRSKILGVPVVRKSLQKEYIQLDPVLNHIVLEYVKYGKGEELVPWIALANKYLNEAVIRSYTGEKTVKEALTEAQKSLESEISTLFNE